MRFTEFFSRSYWAKRRIMKLITPRKGEHLLELLTFGDPLHEAQRILVLRGSMNRCVILIFMEGRLVHYTCLPLLENRRLSTLVKNLEKKLGPAHHNRWEHLDQAFL